LGERGFPSLPTSIGDRQVMTEEVSKYRTLSRHWWVIFIAFTVGGVGLAINQIFLLYPLMDNGYLYWLLALFLSSVFIIIPATKKSPRDRIPWYDVLAFALTAGFSIYLSINAYNIFHCGWTFVAPVTISISSLCLCLLALEAVRRAGGSILFAFATFFFCYPLFAIYMPGVLQGTSPEFWITIRYHALSTDSLLGLPMRVVGTLVIGFMIFGVAMVATGGGKFFLDFAFALLGTRRGGPAKVAIFSSGLFGSLSGSVISNVITTGSMTIPAMRKAGYPNHYAGAIEACASTGGCLMPPVMGTTAFIMASMLGISYWSVAIAAVIPALLYYLGLFMQVDAYAGRVGLKGLQKSDVPSVITTLKEGWPYIFAFCLLIFFLYMRREGQAPFFTTAALLAIAMMRKSTRLDLRGWIKFIEDVGKVLTELVAILAAVGFIMGAFSMTGLGSSLAREIVFMAGGNVILLLLFGATASYILGMGMTVSACYIFLAIVLAPGLVAVGINLMAAHLFVLYWGVVSYITPPVALGSYTAAGLAKSPPMKTGFTSMRLGLIIYLVPFFFVFSPALVLQGTPLETIHVFATCAIGVTMLAGGLAGFLVGFGQLSIYLRLLVFSSGFLLAMPGWQTDLAGIGLLVVLIVLQLMMKRRQSRSGGVTGLQC